MYKLNSKICKKASRINMTPIKVDKISSLMRSLKDYKCAVTSLKTSATSVIKVVSWVTMEAPTPPTTATGSKSRGK